MGLATGKGIDGGKGKGQDSQLLQPGIGGILWGYPIFEVYTTHLW